MIQNEIINICSDIFVDADEELVEQLYPKDSHYRV